MARATWFILTSVVIIAGCAGKQATPAAGMTATPTLDTMTTSASAVTEECAVYKAVIESDYLTEGIELIVIMDHTVNGAYPGASLDSVLEHVRENLGSAVEPETLNDYEAQNGRTQKLDGCFSLDVQYVLLSEVEFNEIFETGGDWSQFYATYPNSQGIMTLSRVGFNANMDQALVYVGNEKEFLAGMGFYALLTKKGDAWVIQSRVVVWIS